MLHLLSGLNSLYLRFIFCVISFFTLSDIFCLNTAIFIKCRQDVDQTEDIRKAIQHASKVGLNIELDTGRFIISSSINIDIKSKGIKIFGAGIDKTVLIYKSSVPSNYMIKCSGMFLEFYDFGLYGSNMVQYGIYSDNITYSQISNMRIQAFNISGVAIGYGWCNKISNVLIQYCLNGIDLVKSSCNSLSITDCVFSPLEGVGILDNSSDHNSVRIVNCVFEKIKKCAIYANCSTNWTIENSYFEEVSSVGYKFDNFDNPIKAGIIINGSGNRMKAAHAYPSMCFSINNNFIAGYDMEFFVIPIASEGLDVRNNSFSLSKKISVVGLIDDSSVTRNSKVTIANNIGPSTKLTLLTPSKRLVGPLNVKNDYKID